MRLKPCPCGKTPQRIKVVNFEQADLPKSAFVTGDCCGQWMIHFHNGWLHPDSGPSIERAVNAWNGAPRRKKK